MTGNSISWNKIFTICGVFGTPFISCAIWLIVNGTRSIDTLTNLVQTVNEVKSTVKDIQSDLKTVHIQIDTIQHQQKYNKLEQDYRFKLQQSQRNN